MDFIVVRAAQVPVAFLELFVCASLLIEQLNGGHAHEVFLEQGVDRGLTLANQTVGMTQLPVDQVQHHKHHGQDRKQDQRDLPVDDEHVNHDGGEHEHIGKRAYHAVRDKALHAVNVRGDSREQGTHGGSVKVALMETHGLLVHGHAQVIDDALSQPGREHALAIPKHMADQCE